MSLKPMGRAVKASMLSLALALGVTACSNDYTVSYVYMTTSRALPHGLMNAYQVDYQSGLLRPLADSPIDTGGRDTVGLVIAPNNLFLYTVNNFDSNVVEFAIGTDGKLYPENTYNITGSLPTAAAIDASGKFLFVAFTYQNTPISYTLANPGPGGITVFPINPDNSLGTPVIVNGLNYIPVGRNPMGIYTSRTGGYVYVIDQDSATTANLLAFSENTSGGLTPIGVTAVKPGNVSSTGYTTGPSPAGILGDATGTHLYVTDNTLGLITTYSTTGGVPAVVPPTATIPNPVPTDAGPMGMSFDLTGKYLYVAAYTANAVDVYSIDATSGLPARSSVAGTVQTGTGPTCVTVSGSPSNANPSHAEYLYTSNQLGNSLTGEQVNQADGTLDQIQGTPFSGSALPTCVATVPALPLR